MIPYALAVAGTVVPLVAGIVRPTVGCLLVAALRSPPMLAAGLFAAATRPIAVPMVTRAADRKRPLTAPAMTSMENGDLGRRHGPPSSSSKAGQPWTACANLRASSLPLGSPSAGRGSTGKPRLHTGVFPSPDSTSTSLPHSPFPTPRFARDDPTCRPGVSVSYGIRGSFTSARPAVRLPGSSGHPSRPRLPQSSSLVSNAEDSGPADQTKRAQPRLSPPSRPSVRRSSRHSFTVQSETCSIVVSRISPSETGTASASNFGSTQARSRWRRSTAYPGSFSIGRRRGPSSRFRVRCRSFAPRMRQLLGGYCTMLTRRSLRGRSQSTSVKRTASAAAYLMHSCAISFIEARFIPRRLNA